LCQFFFQAEDGIRGFHVTGVQTCALPIWAVHVGIVAVRRFVFDVGRRDRDAAFAFFRRLVDLVVGDRGAGAVPLVQHRGDGGRQDRKSVVQGRGGGTGGREGGQANRQRSE